MHGYHLTSRNWYKNSDLNGREWQSQFSVLISGSVALNIFYPLIEALAPAQAWIEAW